MPTSPLNPNDGKFKDRLIIIDPLLKPALNIFQSTGGNAAQIISNFSYVFSTTQQKLTSKQDTCFSFCVRLLFGMKADLMTLLDLLDDEKQDPRFVQAIAKLTKPSQMAARRFFERDFYSKNYASTRQEIKTRVWEILKNDYLCVMLNAPDRKIDIQECIGQRKIVLVNTRMSLLKLAHQTLGRYINALAIDAVQNRSGTPRNTWHPVFIVIDEFQEFADEYKTPEMLRLIREYNAGAILAHHNMYPTEFNDGIRSAISTNTGIKYASDPRGMDINYMARDMQCEAAFLTRQCKKSETHARFGTYFVGLEHPFITEVPLGNISALPQMREVQYTRILENHKRLYGVTEDAPEGPDEAEPDCDTNSLAKIEQKPQPVEKSLLLLKRHSRQTMRTPVSTPNPPGRGNQKKFSRSFGSALCRMVIHCAP